MADDLVNPGSTAANTSAGAPVPVSAQLVLRDPASLFSAGDVVSGRVVQGLGAGQYVLIMRGTTMVVSSQVPLTADTVMRFHVLTSGSQVNLRVVDDASGDQAETSTSAGRLQTLGLPPGNASSLVLAAFENAGAPLARESLLAATDALTSSPGSSPAMLASALAALARDGLPATPATIATALRALSGALPNPAAALAVVQQALANLGTTAPPATAGAQSSAPAPAGSAAPPSPPATALPSQAQSQAQSPVAPGDLADGATEPSPPRAPPAPGGQAPAAGGAGAPVQASGPPPASALPESGAAPASSTSGTAASAAAGASAATTPAASDSAAAPSSNAQTAAAPRSDPASSGMSIPAGAGVPDGEPEVADRPLTAGPPAQLPTGDGALRELLSLGTPDATRGGSPAVMQALDLAGVRSSAAPPSTGSLVKRLAAALPAVEDQVSVATKGLSSASRADLSQAIVLAVRESSAMTVVKPASLADYDVVLGVPLQDQGRSTPTRIAVASRPAVGGTATFVRVDTELSHLGSISVRLSGLQDGPMAITLLADGPGGQALAEALPGLAESLQQLGMVAGLRVASLAADDGHG